MEKAHLELLGYSSKWVEYGLLTPELLDQQVRYYQTGKDTNTEHYRYAAFKEIQRRRTFSDLEFERYVDLAASDPDPAMGRAALIDLIYHRGLIEAQWETVLVHPRLQELPKLVKKERLLKELRAPNVTLETLQRCVDEGDGWVQRAVLDLPELPRSIVETLHQSGRNKAVRNIAGVRLKYGDRREG